MLRRYLPRSAKKPIFLRIVVHIAYTVSVCSSLHSLSKTVISFKPLLFIKRLNKIQVLTCSLKLAHCRAGLLNISVAMDLSLYLLRERDYVPWATALQHFQAWSRYLAESAPYRLFLRYLKHLLGPVAHSLGWEDTGTHMMK